MFRSGKSSIQKVVFHKMSPNETLFLESTAKVVKDGIHFVSSAANFSYDFAAQYILVRIIMGFVRVLKFL